MRFLRPRVPILSQKLSFSFFPDVGVRGDFGRGREAIFTVYEFVSSITLTKSAVRILNTDIRIIRFHIVNRVLRITYFYTVYSK